MGLAVVTVAAGGLPVTESTVGGTPVTEATNGRGVPVTKVAARGLPVVFETIGVAASTPVLTTFATLNGTPTGGVVVSNGGLTATHTTTNNSVGVTSTLFRSTGKFYFEAAIQVSFTNANSVGLIVSTGVPGDLRLGTNGIIIGFGASCLVTVNSSAVSPSLGAIAVGNVFCMAVDVGNRLFWGRRNAGFWNASGTADPVAGTGGITFGTGGLSYGPGVGFTGAGATDAVTMNFGQSGFVHTAPSGFSLGWGT